ncbi:secretion protein HlyD [Arthrobacter sp. ISL-48]|uniref:secretion protein HlyD n=1 Tax=Arthrobacter sp. ISL-48 TaxID=2819110 RepID=UPI001BEBB674|nr:secretion protein HlyD [Arthrobacter sp. ISL-48]MBT2534051.1 secretion protein HlyD [Arthrobacter sp. ISL-48]
MRVFRRVILPTAWLAVFAVIAVSLIKIAFVDGMEPEPAVAGPGAEVAIPVVQASRATVTNKVEIKATVQNDAAVGVRNTVAGVVMYIFVEPGAKVSSGDALYQVRGEVQPARPEVEASAEAATGTGVQGSEVPQPSRTTALPTYTYTDVLAPAGGQLKTLDVLIDQQVSVGQAAGSVDPGTYTVSGSVDAAQQYRLLAKPGSAQVSLVGGPAPFTCPAVDLKSVTGAAGEAAVTSGLAGGLGGGVSRTVPYATAGPGASGGAPEQGGTPTGTLSCAVPTDVEVFAGLGATMTVTAGEAVNVVTVPLTSVEGSVKEGIVWLAGAGMAPNAGSAAAGAPAGTAPADGTPPGSPMGEPQQRKVKLGLNDGSLVEVVSGLAEGEAVLEFIPGAPAQAPMGPQFGGPGFPMGG